MTRKRSTFASREVRRHGLVPLVAGDGERAIELIRSDPSSLVLAVLDLWMPRADGLTVAVGSSCSDGLIIGAAGGTLFLGEVTAPLYPTRRTYLSFAVVTRSSPFGNGSVW